MVAARHVPPIFRPSVCQTPVRGPGPSNRGGGLKQGGYYTSYSIHYTLYTRLAWLYILAHDYTRRCGTYATPTTCAKATSFPHFAVYLLKKDLSPICQAYSAGLAEFLGVPVDHISRAFMLSMKAKPKKHANNTDVRLYIIHYTLYIIHYSRSTRTTRTYACLQSGRVTS